MDPLCEKYYGVSPYVYCHDNPVNRIDPDGKKVVLFGTKLPADVNSEHPWLHIIAGSATHTFVAVIDDKTNKLNGYISNYIKSVCTMFLLDYLIVSIGYSVKYNFST